MISPAHGLGILGIIQCWIASTVLSKYVHKFEQASGFLCFIIGCLNVILVGVTDVSRFAMTDPHPPQGLVFRASAKPRRSLFSWENLAQLSVSLTAHTFDADTQFVSLL